MFIKRKRGIQHRCLPIDLVFWKKKKTKFGHENGLFQWSYYHIDDDQLKTSLDEFSTNFSSSFKNPFSLKMIFSFQQNLYPNRILLSQEQGFHIQDNDKKQNNNVWWRFLTYSNSIELSSQTQTRIETMRSTSLW